MFFVKKDLAPNGDAEAFGQRTFKWDGEVKSSRAFHPVYTYEDSLCVLHMMLILDEFQFFDCVHMLGWAGLLWGSSTDEMIHA